MAKKRKAAKKAVKKKAAKKAAPRKVAAKPLTGLEVPGKVNFDSLKKQMGAHIAALEAAKAPNDKIANALKILRTAQADLTRECLPTMELQTS